MCDNELLEMRYGRSVVELSVKVALLGDWQDAQISDGTRGVNGGAKTCQHGSVFF